MQTFNVYRLDNDGGASWIISIEAETASDALARCHAGFESLTPFNTTYIVLPCDANPNGRQVVFTLVEAKPEHLFEVKSQMVKV